MLTINITLEEIIDNRLDDSFQFDSSSSLVCKEVKVSNNMNHINNEYDMEINDMQPSACQTNTKRNNNNRKLLCVLNFWSESYGIMEVMTPVSARTEEMLFVPIRRAW